MSNSKWKCLARLTLSVLVILAAWSVLAWQAAKWLVVKKPLDRADAIVMLSGSATYHERALQTARLYNLGCSKRILLTNDNLMSGWSSAQQRNPYFYERTLDDLQELGVPRQDIEVLGPLVTSTHDEAVLLRDYSEKHGLNSLLIVTSPYHSRRALLIFRDVFHGSNTALGMEPPGTGLQSPDPTLWWLNITGWRTVLPEYPKMIIYLFRVN